MHKINWLEHISDGDARQISDKFWDHLSEHAYPVSKGKMRIPISLEPFVLSSNKYNTLHNQVELVISGAKKLAEAFYYDKDLENLLAIDIHEKNLIQLAKNDRLVGIIRVDIFYGETPKIVEINADFPDGFFMHDITSAAINDMLTGEELQHDSNTELFIELLKSEHVAPDDHIFIGYNKERTFIDEFELTKIKLEAANWKNISVGAFEDLTFSDGTFYFNQKAVDVIRRGAELSKLREIPELLNQLAEAQKVSKLKIINNFKMRLLGHKSLLAAMHDERFAKYLSQEELGAIQALVPKTGKFDPSETPIILAQKDRWVLKPSDLAEGNGVSIGSSLSPEAWADALSTASLQPDKWILQEKISIPKQKFTLLNEEDEGRSHVDRYFDLDPHVVLFEKHSKFGNILVRFSSSEILNVMKGGGLTYAFRNKS